MATVSLAISPPASCRTGLHLGPDFVIELNSESDRLCKKMDGWLSSGAQLDWLRARGDVAKRQST